jgi:hypothetical protein
MGENARLAAPTIHIFKLKKTDFADMMISVLCGLPFR